MHAERTGHESDATQLQDDGATGERLAAPELRPAHSIMDCLMPATPPQPKNARVIRLFDYEEKHEVRPRAESVAKPPKEESKNREAAKAARNQSLLAAAGLA